MSHQEDRNVNGNVGNTNNNEDNNKMRQEKTLESPADRKPKTRKARRTKREIEAEYQIFKEYFDNGFHHLEIATLYNISEAQCKTYLSRISLNRNNFEQENGACKGFNLPKQVLNHLNGGKNDTYRIIKDQDSVVITLIKTLTT